MKTEKLTKCNIFITTACMFLFPTLVLIGIVLWDTFGADMVLRGKTPVGPGLGNAKTMDVSFLKNYYHDDLSWSKKHSHDDLNWSKKDSNNDLSWSKRHSPDDLSWSKKHSHDDLSWPKEASLHGERNVHDADGVFLAIERSYRKDFEKRDLAVYFPSNMFKQKVNPTTPKIKGADDVTKKVRVPRGLSKYHHPIAARAAHLKKHSHHGKHGFDDSYFLSPGTACKVPEGLQTIDVRCKMWPTYKRCISYCVYGSTFDEGIQREHSCTYRENRWSKDFDECKPFVNCKVQLKSPGNVKCFDNELSTRPYCEIHCEIHEDKDEVKTQAYHCNANATWTPPLPFCVQPREHVKLANAPKVIEHTGFKYPEATKPGAH